MSERASGKARKSSASKALTSKQPASTKAAAPKKAGGAGGKARNAKAGKGKSSSKRTSQNVAALEPAALNARVAQLESERERLLAALEKAENRIRALEDGRDQVLNRIDWVIDSLRSLIETEQ
jgi:hypothetical protein